MYTCTCVVVMESCSPLVNSPAADCEDGDGCVRLYLSSENDFSGRQGIVQVKQNGTWNFVNGSGWDYCDANVICRDLGECMHTPGTKHSALIAC